MSLICYIEEVWLQRLLLSHAVMALLNYRSNVFMYDLKKKCRA